MAAPLGRLALIPLFLITACHQPVPTSQTGPVPYAVSKQVVVDNTTTESPAARWNIMSTKFSSCWEIKLACAPFSKATRTGTTCLSSRR